jgi:hypothetical protein
VNGALGEAAHPKQALFQFVQVFFEVAFHEPFLASAIALPKKSRSPPRRASLTSFGMTNHAPASTNNTIIRNAP